MGVGSYSNEYYYPRVIYPNQRILYVTQPGTVLVPQQNYFPMPYPPPQNMPGRIIITNTNMAAPHGMRIMMNPHKPKKTIQNLSQYFEETELTQSILDKGKQKSCSICLEDFKVGDKIMYLPCFDYYHSKCIETWVHNSDRCPLCNTEIKIP